MVPTTQKTVVLLTGATGYIGGSVLAQLLALPDASSKFDFRAIVRNSEKARKFKDLLGVNAIVGSHGDRELMVREASQADVVLAMADCDDIEALGATLDGLKKRYEATGKAPVLFHTSGTVFLYLGVISDNAGGELSQIIWDDTDIAQMGKIASDAPHRRGELKVLNADQEGYVKSYILLPSAIYGVLNNPVVDAGIQNTRSQLFDPGLFPAAFAKGRGFVVGKGDNIWPIAHIDELAEVYTRLFVAVTDDEGFPHGTEGYYLIAADEVRFYDLAEAVSEALNDLGELEGTSTDPTQITKEECTRYYGSMPGLVGSNMRCASNRARTRLGWTPTKTTKDLLATVRGEVESYKLSLEKA
ncbi:hypothetical protein PQX77_011450 [Marasmius sp. AFHP31]|nr:hypothetical protein PQX77_011450 [Marasmius sp. AFHP31]